MSVNNADKHVIHKQYTHDACQKKKKKLYGAKKKLYGAIKAIKECSAQETYCF